MALTDATIPALTGAIGNAGTVQDFQGTTVFAGPGMQPARPNIQNWWRQQFGACAHAFVSADPWIRTYFLHGGQGGRQWQQESAPRLRPPGGGVINYPGLAPLGLGMVGPRIYGLGATVRVQTVWLVSQVNNTYTNIGISTTDPNPDPPNDTYHKAKWRGSMYVSRVNGGTAGDTYNFDYATTKPANPGDIMFARIYYWQGEYLPAFYAPPPTLTYGFSVPYTLL